jgi:hypothetical protein
MIFLVSFDFLFFFYFFALFFGSIYNKKNFVIIIICMPYLVFFFNFIFKETTSLRIKRIIRMHKEIFLICRICLPSMAIIFPKIEFFIKTITVAQSTDKSFDIKNRKIKIIKNIIILQTCKKNLSS